MTDQKTMAYINLYAVLGTLENLCEIVPEASAMLTNTKPISIGFEVKDGPSATITFKNGRCRMEQGVSKCDVKLPFSSCEKFNGLIDGTVTPIPSKGFQHIKFLLKTFTPLTDLLAKYMRPSPEDLQDRTFFEQSTTLMLYTIAVAISQIANNDKIGQFSASHIVDGEIGFGIKDGPAVTIRAKNGRLRESTRRDGVRFNGSCKRPLRRKDKRRCLHRHGRYHHEGHDLDDRQYEQTARQSCSVLGIREGNFNELQD